MGLALVQSIPPSSIEPPDRVPLVTLGVPVRNDAAMLRPALESMVGQTHGHLEIIVSDNASNDATPIILQEFAAQYSFIRVIRHEQPLTAIDNFLFVLTQAKGEFFAWCAHDDTRSADFVSGLMSAFDNPDVVLAFGDLYIWDGANPPVWRKDYHFSNAGLSRTSRLRKAAHMQCYHIYGLWRTNALRRIKYNYTPWWPDMPIMLAAAADGVFRHVTGPNFIYYEVTKTEEERARSQNFQEPASKIGNVLSLLRAVFRTVRRTSGLSAGAIATVFVAEKYFRYAPIYLYRRVLSKNRGATC